MLREQSEQSTYDSRNIGIHLVQTKIDKDRNVDPLAWEIRLATAWPKVVQVSIPARSFGEDGLDLLSPLLNTCSNSHSNDKQQQFQLGYTTFYSSQSTWVHL